MEMFLDKEELAKILNIPLTSIDLYRRQRGLPSLKIGKHRRYVLKDVQKWLNHNKDNN